MRFAAILTCVAACSSSEKKPAAPSTPVREVVYSIDLAAAVDDRARALRDDLDAGLTEQMMRAAIRLPVHPPGAITIVPDDAAKKPEITTYVASTYRDVLERRACDAADGADALCFAIAASHAATIKKAALQSAVTTIRERLDVMKVASPMVFEKAGQIVVQFPADDDKGAALRDLVARTGKLEMKVVDSGSEYMRRVFEHVGSEGTAGDPKDPAARSAEIRADVDQWPMGNDGVYVDYYLLAADREVRLPVAEARALGCLVGPDVVDNQTHCRVSGRIAIQRYLDALAATDPSFRVPDDREIGFELVLPLPDAKDQRLKWRSYFLERPARITGAAIANAEGITDPNTGQPLVLLDFNRHGTRLFEQLTSEIVGKKLATILDGTIKSAPIILGTIRGGRASITMGGTDRRRQERERDELVHVLRTGALPAPLREESSRVLP